MNVMWILFWKNEVNCPDLFRVGVVDSWLTDDDECNAVSEQYECGGVYHHNYMDILGCRNHDYFWDCSSCKYK